MDGPNCEYTQCTNVVNFVMLTTIEKESCCSCGTQTNYSITGGTQALIFFYLLIHTKDLCWEPLVRVHEQDMIARSAGSMRWMQIETN